MTIYFATNRNPNDSTKPTDFENYFSKNSLGDLRFGQVNVDVEGNLDFENLVMLPNNESEGSKQLFAQLQNSMKENQDDSLVFIHGFNTSFKEAMKSALKMKNQYRRLSNGSYNPNVFVFSWVSYGQLSMYDEDRVNAKVSANAVARALLKLANFLKNTSPDNACEQRIDLIAHSMGCYVLRHALQELRKQSVVQRMFHDVVLVAADEDSDTFEFDYKLGLLSSVAKRITVYFNSGDSALKVSDIFQGNPDRLGRDGANKPHQLPSKVVLVEVSDVVSGVVEHSYFNDNDCVSKDIVKVLKGQSSESIKERDYLPHKNKFKLLA